MSNEVTRASRAVTRRWSLRLDAPATIVKGDALVVDDNGRYRPANREQANAAEAKPEAPKCEDCNKPSTTLAERHMGEDKYSVCDPCYVAKERNFAKWMRERDAGREQPKPPSMGPLPRRYPTMGWNKRAVR